MFIQVKIDGDEVAKGNLNGAAQSLYDLIAQSSRFGTLERGDAFALGPFRPPRAIRVGSSGREPSSSSPPRGSARSATACPRGPRPYFFLLAAFRAAPRSAALAASRAFFLR